MAVARRAELLREYRASGLTQAAFARREGLNYSTFAGWVQRMTATAPEPIEFAQLRLPPVLPPSPKPALTSSEPVELEVRLPDGTLVRGSKVKELALLVRALRA